MAGSGQLLLGQNRPSWQSELPGILNELNLQPND